jgi:hypothetical protein
MNATGGVGSQSTGSATAGPDGVLRRVASVLLDQIAHIGLMLGVSPNSDENLGDLERHCRVVHFVASACGHLGLLPSMTGRAVLYNPAAWSSDQLCGRVGEHLDVPATDIVISHADLWLTSARQPERAVQHLFKCLVWWHENHGARIDATIDLLLDLHRAGYIVHADIYRQVLALLWLYCNSDVKLPELMGTTRKDLARINAAISQAHRRLVAEAKRLAPDEDPVLAALLARITSDIWQARAARTLDEWLIHEIRLYHPMGEMATAFHSFRSMPGSPIQIAVLSQIEEMKQDLEGSLGLLLTLALSGHALRWHVLLYPDVYGRYRKMYRNKGLALRHYTEDRLLFPDAVRDLLQATRLPADLETIEFDGWASYGPTMARPICLAYGLDAKAQRSQNFARMEVAAEMDSLLRSEGRESSDGETRRQLLKKRAVLLGILANRLRGTERDREWLEQARRLHPWNGDLHRLHGIIEGLGGDIDAMAEDLFNAIVLEPGDAPNWFALARLLERTGREPEAEVAGAIGEFVQSTDGRVP